MGGDAEHTTWSGDRLAVTESLSSGGPEPHHHELIARYRKTVAQTRWSWMTHLRMIRKLGEGGQGIVFLAERPGADGFTLPVAVKVFSADRYRTPEDYDEDMIRMGSVASLVAQIQHDNLLQVQNFLDRERIRMLVMEWVEGFDLRQLLTMRMFALGEQRFSEKRWRHINQVLMTAGPEQPRFQPGVAIAIARNCLDGLAALHRDGIVHGDVKPANVMIKRSGQAKLVDIGSAFEMDHLPPRRACTPAYASLEVLQGDPGTPRSDLASLGFLLVELLAGRSLVASRHDLGAVIRRKQQIISDLPGLLPPEVVRNDLLMGFIKGLVSPDPSERFASADEAVNADRGAAAFHRQLVKGDMSSEYQNDLRVWVEELLEFEEDHGSPEWT